MKTLLGVYTCGHCEIMATNEECVCCMEFPEVVGKKSARGSPLSVPHNSSKF